jgi:hypothetical protein
MPFPCRDPAVALRGRFQNGIFVAWQGNGMVCVNQTRPHCVNQVGKTQFKPLPERHGLCKSALTVTFMVNYVYAREFSTVEIRTQKHWDLIGRRLTTSTLYVISHQYSFVIFFSSSFHTHKEECCSFKNTLLHPYLLTYSMEQSPS